MKDSILVHSLPLSLCLLTTFGHLRLRTLFCGVKFVCLGEHFEQSMHKTHVIVASQSVFKLEGGQQRATGVRYDH